MRSKHYIYEIFGKKIGVTNDVLRRMKEQNVKEGEYRIIEEHTNAKVASEREITLQKEHNYPVDRIQYWKTLKMQKKAVTKEARKKAVANTDYKALRVKGVKNTDWAARVAKVDWKAKVAKMDYKAARAKAVANTDYSYFTLSHWQTPEIIKKRVANSNYIATRGKGSEKLKKPINQYDLEGNFIKRWDGAIDAARFLNKKGSGDITDCCKGKLKTAYKFIWKYA